MVSVGNETVKIGSDSHLVINGVRLDEKTPHFGNVYGPNKNPDELYFGHAPMNDFENQREVFVHRNHFMVMGDNTHNSLDSRYFGEIDSNAIIGKQFFVYWPLTKRFGWGTE